MFLSLGKRLKKPKLKKGLTLVEVLIVLAIIGIMAVVVVPGFIGYMRKAKYTATEQTLRTTKTEVMRYESDAGMYPASLEDLVEKPEDVPSRKWHGPYFGSGKVPKDGWGHELEYQRTQGGKHPFELFSWGPEGVDSADTISVWDLD